MSKRISKNKHALNGIIYIPSDKSISHRAAMIASMIKGRTLIKNFSHANDPSSTLEICKNLGVNIEYANQNDIIISSQGKFRKYSHYMDCGNSGTTMRLMSGILASQNFNCILIGDESLSKRPMRRIIEPLTKMGAVIYSSGNLSPLYINGQKLKGINYRSKISSAQVKSCLLLAGLNAEGVTTVTEPSLSRNHTEIMLQYLNADIDINGISVSIKPSQIEPKVLEIPGDISSAAFFIAAALIIPGSDIIIKNVGLNPTRTGILEIANTMGGNIEILDKRCVCGELTGDIRVRYSEELKGITIEGDIIPKLIDELPVIAVMATQAEGQTIVKDAGDLRNKESDRIAAINYMLKLLGADIAETDDGFIINGKTPFYGGVEIETFSDHRLAMSAYVAGLLCEKQIYIKDFDCVNISFPEFEKCFNKILL